jgi:hypothetical protein
MATRAETRWGQGAIAATVRVVVLASEEVRPVTTFTEVLPAGVTVGR